MSEGVGRTIVAGGLNHRYLRAGAIAATLCLATGMRAYGQELVSTLVAPPEASAIGSEIIISVLRVNPAGTDMPFDAPVALNGRLIAGARIWPVTLTARNNAPATVAAGGFASQAYTLIPPADAAGTVILEVTQGVSGPGNPPSRLRAVLQIEAGIAPPLPGTAAADPLASIAPEAVQLQSGFVGRFGVHDPIYIVFGNEDPTAKFQFSFKYRVLNLPAVAGERPAVRFGYTQRSLWELGSSSSPFYDTSYIPSLFTEWFAPAASPERDAGIISLVGLQAGYQHESNGQPDDDSRSLNILFARASFLFGSSEGWHLVATPRAFAYIGGLSDNRDVARYRGYGDLQMTLGKAQGTALSYTGRVGSGFKNVTTQLDLTIPIRTEWLDFASYLTIQYFNGYGENLRDFDQRLKTLRVGIALLR